MLSDSHLASPYVSAISRSYYTLLISASRLLRAWALWNQRRAVGIFFIALCCGAMIASIVTFWNRALVSVEYPIQLLMKMLMASSTFLE